MAGQDFDLATVALVDGTGEDDVLDDLDHAVTAGLLAEVSGATGRFTFRHALVQQTLYEQVGPTRRRRLHRQVAEALEAVTGPDAGDRGDRLGELAHHWLLGYRPDEVSRAVDHARRAGEHALANLAPDQAMRWFREAAARLEKGAGDDTLTTDVLIGLGEAQRDLGDQAFRETLLTVGRRAEAAGDTQRLVRAAVANNRGAVSASGKVDAERVALLESAIRATDATETAGAAGGRPGPERALLCATLATELTSTPEGVRRRMLSDEALRSARLLGDPALLGRVLALRFEAIWAPSTHAERLAETAELLDLAQRSEDRRLRFFAARFRSFACWEGGRTAESDQHLDAECRNADEIGQPYLQWVATLSRAGRLLAAARTQEAEAAAEDALRIGAEADEPDAMLAYGAQLLQIRRQQGRGSELLPVLQGVGSLGGFDEFDLRPGMAMIHCEAGSFDKARAVAGDLLAGPFPPPGSHIEAETLTLLSEIAAALDEADAARRLYDSLGACSGLLLVDQVVRHGPFDHHLGLLATAAGDLGTVDGHFARAVGLSSSVPLPYWRAEAEVGWARALLRRREPGDAAQARALLGSAAEAAGRLGLGGTLRKAAALSEGAGT